MKRWLQNLMSGRYGSDELSFVLLMLYLGVCIFAMFTHLRIFQLLGLAIILWAFFRILSRNIPAPPGRKTPRFLGFLSRTRRKPPRPPGPSPGQGAPLLPLQTVRRHHARAPRRGKDRDHLPQVRRKADEKV